VLAVVHAETSTGAQYPLQELGEAMRGRDTFLFADCVTSLGAIPLAFSEWGVDFAYSCTQKALAAPPGMSPIAFSDRALARARARRAADVAARQDGREREHRGGRPRLRRTRRGPRGGAGARQRRLRPAHCSGLQLPSDRLFKRTIAQELQDMTTDTAVQITA